jgi:hypothetical protein
MYEMNVINGVKSSITLVAKAKRLALVGGDARVDLNLSLP